MTMQEMISSTKDFLTPGDVAKVLHSDPHTIRVTAHQRPDLIKYPFTFTGSRMKIPRIPFLHFLGVET